MKKPAAVIVWALGAALANVLLFTLERGMTPTFWITFAYTWIAFLSSLAFQWYVKGRSQTTEDSLLHIPGLVITVFYELIQLPLCIIFALGSAAIPGKLVFLIHTVVLIAAWTSALLSLGGNEHIKKVNSRQKDHHKEL